MMINNKILLCLAGFSVVLGGCSLEAKKGPSLLLRFDPNDTREELAPQNWFRSDVGTRSAPVISDFACIGVNVTGNGIGDSSTHDPYTAAQSQALYQSMLAGKSCSYRGVVGGVTQRRADGTYLPLDVSLQIPAGPERLVQVFGVGNVQGTGGSPTALCSSALQDDNTNSSGEKLIYELARARLPAVFSSQSITLNSNLGDTAAWSDPRNKMMDCETGSSEPCVTAGIYSVSADAEQAVNPGGAVKKIGIPFTVTTPFTVNSVNVSLKLTGTGSDAVISFAIYANSAGSPSTQLVGPITANLVGVANSETITVTLPGNTLSQSVTYWLVMSPDSAGALLPNNSGGSVGAKTFNSVWSVFSGAPLYEIKLCP